MAEQTVSFCNDPATMVKDPVCGMTVDPAKVAGREDYNGATYYFCGQSCTAKFRADPEKYLQPRPVSSQAAAKQETAAAYTCPMHPEVEQDGPGACPKCGMALEPSTFAAPATKTEYTCPMHPEIVRGGAGECPICGMALEPRTITLDEANPELDSMMRRLWTSTALTVPLLLIMLAEVLPGHPIRQVLSGRVLGWIELVLATPVVLWGGLPFFERGWASIVSRNLNMFTLIAIGSGAAFLYSVAAVLAPADVSFVVPRHGWRTGTLLRGGCRYHGAGVAGSGAGIEGAEPDEWRDQSVAGACPEDRAPHRGGRHGTRCGFE